LLQFISTRKQKRDILAFTLELVEYMYSRFRVVLILLSVLFDIFSNFIDFFKDKIIKRMFWGRGTFLKSALQVTLTFIVFILVISYVYRRPVVIEASADSLDTVGVPQTDTMIATTSLNTLIPKDRARSSTIEYVVKRGDTLSSIAAENQVSVQTILWANNMSSSDYLKLGQTLNIPPRDGVIVTVKSGDTVESLAKKYSADAADIVDAAWLEAPYTLTVGTQLFIPNGAMPVVVIAKATSTPTTYKQTSVGYVATAADPNVGKFLGRVMDGPYAMSRGYFAGHYGMDFYPTGGGRPHVVAACAGTVISSGWGYSGTIYSGYGNYAHVDCGNGYTILNAHMANLAVSAGQYVSKGQPLGVVGATGVAYGVHTHFELRRGASLAGRMNPAPYIQ
jgi:murein DD-endopeptidase MepM/ murein hydrolase activator NlpD